MRTPKAIIRERLRVAKEIISEAKTPVTPRVLADKMGISAQAAKNLLVKIALYGRGKYRYMDSAGFSVWR